MCVINAHPPKYCTEDDETPSMGLIESVKDAIASPSPKGRPDDGSKGAYWCDDCDLRVRDVELNAAPDEDATCPDCGETMRFERSSGRSCAC